MKNSALIFVKPHAAKPSVIDFIKSYLQDHHVTLLNSGEIDGSSMDKAGIIDKHYFAISETAMHTNPVNLHVPDTGRSNFSSAFGEEFDAALKTNKVLNCQVFMEKYQIGTGAELQKVWAEGSFVKLGPGLYAGYAKNQDKYLINGFYPLMRDKFTTASARVFWYTVQFSPEKLPWKHFRNNLIGTTDPAKAASGSIRNILYQNYADYGLNEGLSMSNNAIHASAGPIEGMREILVWTGLDPMQQELAQSLHADGLSEQEIHKLINNAHILFDEKEGPAFDITEDCDAIELKGKIRVY